MDKSRQATTHIAQQFIKNEHLIPDKEILQMIRKFPSPSFIVIEKLRQAIATSGACQDRNSLKAHIINSFGPQRKTAEMICQHIDEWSLEPKRLALLHPLPKDERTLTALWSVLVTLILGYSDHAPIVD